MSAGYTIEDARLAIRGAGFVSHLLDQQEEATVRMARLAIREHERAEALAARVVDLEAACRAHELASQWIPHGGGPQPVEGLVWVRYRNGYEHGPDDADSLWWEHLGPIVDGDDDDIVAYRTTDPDTTASPTAGEE